MTAFVARASHGLLQGGGALVLADLPVLDGRGFHEEVVGLCSAAAHLSALVAMPSGREIVAVVSLDDRDLIALARCVLDESRSYPALTPELPQAQAFERALFEEHGIVPDGHPWLKPLRRQLGSDFFQVQGTAIHEVAVGPVHAGIIEPGHFRFQCQGEWVKHLEIELGYQHRGVEQLLLSSSPARRVVIAESIAGDSAVGHAWAHCALLETLAGITVPEPAGMMRAVMLELERLANHTGDLGALCNDVGYLPGSSWLGRLRGDFLNLMLELSGNRFGRGLVVPGGVRFGLRESGRRAFSEQLARAEHDFANVAALSLDAPSVQARFEGTGRLSRLAASELGLVGVAARASGLELDVRRDHPLPPYLQAKPPWLEGLRGDVLARALVRRDEALWSARFIRERLDTLPESACSSAPSALRPDRIAVALVEGFRGEIAHVAITDAHSNIAVYCVVDPSLHNWFGLAFAMRENLISDFPLCNKSFNLSYAGHDL